MEQETKNNYIDFYRNMHDACCKIDDNPLSVTYINTAEYRVELVKTSYLYLKEEKVEDIEHLRGCLNTLEKELGMEVTENDSE